jgi:hypothetical protein
MTRAEELQQSGLRTAATIRRAYAAFNQETAEFGMAACAGSRELMETARQRAHDHLDAYFDGVAAAHAIGQEDGSGHS